MAKIKNKKMNQELEKEARGRLLKAFRRVESRFDLEIFLNKFMTPSEKALFLRRFAVIILLEHKMKYKDIENTLAISSGTISRIKYLISGAGRGNNFHKKRQYSALSNRKPKRFVRKYKGAESIMEIFPF